MQTQQIFFFFFCTGEDKLVFLKKVLGSFLAIDSLIDLFLQVTQEHRSVSKTLALHTSLTYPATTVVLKSSGVAFWGQLLRLIFMCKIEAVRVKQVWKQLSLLSFSRQSPGLSIWEQQMPACWDAPVPNKAFALAQKPCLGCAAGVWVQERKRRIWEDSIGAVCEQDLHMGGKINFLLPLAIRYRILLSMGPSWGHSWG